MANAQTSTGKSAGKSTGTKSQTKGSSATSKGKSGARAGPGMKKNQNTSAAGGTRASSAGGTATMPNPQAWAKAQADFADFTPRLRRTNPRLATRLETITQPIGLTPTS